MTRPQEIRKEILMQLYAGRPIAMSPSLIARQARKSGLDYTETEVRQECAFLHGTGLAQSQLDRGTGEMRYAISSEGIIHHENS